MKIVSALIVVVAITMSSAWLLGTSKTAIAKARSGPAQDSSANQSSMEQQIIAKEREGLDALKTGDLERFGKLTADEAVLVDAQGPASKAQVLKNVAGFTLTDYSMDDMKFVPISPNTGLISYEISEKGVSHGKEFMAKAYVSSIWTQRGDTWVCLFSQETGAR